MRTFLFAAVAVVAFSVGPGGARSKDAPREPDLATRVRDLEERLARVEKQLTVPPADVIRFGDVVVNLNDDRNQRYIRIVVAFKVEEASHRELSARVLARKAELKTWMITYLADKSIKDVSGSAGINRVRDDMRQGLGKILQQNRKENPIKEVLFEEYVVQ
ncbi:MAG: flagellar basal body-associated FliL family protein [Planctomycetes bacterium]|nr:flagellar basal body-associated FliL family protein [Planctomycetota bacterium]